MLYSPFVLLTLFKYYAIWSICIIDIIYILCYLIDFSYFISKLFCYCFYGGGGGGGMAKNLYKVIHSVMTTFD